MTTLKIAGLVTLFSIFSITSGCPKCGSKKIVKNGMTSYGKQNYRCKNCKRQFVKDNNKKTISQQTKDLIDDLLLEKVPLAGIARVAKVSESWLQNYVNKKYESIPRTIKTIKKKAE